MAEQLNMNGLNLNDGGVPDQGQAPLRSYIPPHMRGKMGGPAPTAGPPAALNGNAGIAGSAWAAPAA